ncbi:putative CD209 antigen-like [Scophthalmus maximus]|uniref:Putative CD209 antigen-like n=1 Tax=Scophthalmus maximus TaxID=52904 RepID=A0A2U9B6A2_SCOMX|nr:putative CD209 antigen-like [Scophthalmus maximus]
MLTLPARLGRARLALLPPVPEEQKFLTKLVQEHPQENVKAAWIGSNDIMLEGDFLYFNGNRMKSNVICWIAAELNDICDHRNKASAGQDGVGPLTQQQIEEYRVWNEIGFAFKRPYL